VEAGQRPGGFILFAGGEQPAKVLFQTSQVRFDAAIVLVFAFAGAHSSFG